MAPLYHYTAAVTRDVAEAASILMKMRADSQPLPGLMDSAPRVPDGSRFTPRDSSSTNKLALSSVFPILGAMPMPSDPTDAHFVSLDAEDTMRHWVTAGKKEDRFVQVGTVTDARGKSQPSYRLYYMDDGGEIKPWVPRRSMRRNNAQQAPAAKATKAAIPTKAAKPSPASRSSQPSQPTQFSKPTGASSPTQIVEVPDESQAVLRPTRMKKQPLDSGISMGGDCDLPPAKRLRSNSDNVAHFASLSNPGTARSQAFDPGEVRKVSDSTNSNGSAINKQDMSNLRAILSSTMLTTIAGATGRREGGSNELSDFDPEYVELPTASNSMSITVSATQASVDSMTVPQKSGLSRRVTAPAAITAPRPPRDLPKLRKLRDRHADPVVAASKGQHTDAAISTPSYKRTAKSADKSTDKKKYVPTTSNPIRWSAAELYCLNEHARKGLAPQDLHPLMMEKFPYIPRSIHAIKDRRDKMARAKELEGRIPNYSAKYGAIQMGQLMN